MIRTTACMLLLWGCLASCKAAEAPPCLQDHEALLAMAPAEFDQNRGPGWREIAARPECESVAADLLRDYRLAHPEVPNPSLLYWHEAQLRGFLGDSPAAIALMEASRVSAEQDRMGWNAYVDATTAFLRRDASTLAQARARLAATPPLPGMPAPKEGVIETKNLRGQPMKMRWPPNLQAVDGLVHCFDKSYREAYSSPACRTP